MNRRQLRSQLRLEPPVKVSVEHPPAAFGEGVGGVLVADKVPHGNLVSLHQVRHKFPCGLQLLRCGVVIHEVPDNAYPDTVFVVLIVGRTAGMRAPFLFPPPGTDLDLPVRPTVAVGDDEMIPHFVPPAVAVHLAEFRRISALGG